MDKKVLAEKLGILQDMAAKQENFLELTAVLDCLRDVQVTPEELEEVYSRLERKGIRVGTPEGDAELEPELDLEDDFDTGLDAGVLGKDKLLTRRQRTAWFCGRSRRNTARPRRICSARKRPRRCWRA